jgi:cytochrome c556
VVPVGAPEEPTDPGTPAPELSPAEILAKIEQDRARWNQQADDLRTVALASLSAVKTRDPEALFKVGGDIDNACEACHLEYWYPGDKPAVLRNRNSTVTPPK